MGYHLCVKTEPAQEKQKTTSEPQMAELYICMTNCAHKPASNFATVWNVQHHLHVHSMFEVYTHKIVTEKSHFFNLDNYKT